MAGTENASPAAPPTRPLTAADLPQGNAPPALEFTHFPSRLHAFVWRNWPLIPADRMAKVVGCAPEEIRHLGASLGLEPPAPITDDLQARSYITVIRRNWHLLPYDQLLTLLAWDADKLAFVLREDDFLYVKLGGHKPRCTPIRFAPTLAMENARAREIAARVGSRFPVDPRKTRDPLFGFVSRLSAPPPMPVANPQPPAPAAFSPRFCYSYFALYGDPLLDPTLDPYPDGYLARLAESGVNGVWLQAVLHKLALFPWDERLSVDYEKRLVGLKALVARARRHGISVYLYLNEPRAMPLAFYESRPELKGVVEGDHAALCTSRREVREYLSQSVASIVRAVPELGGFFTITGSENLTNCWSHNSGGRCPRCSQRSPAEVIAELNTAFYQGIREAGGRAQLIAWDWGWANDWVEAIIQGLPAEAVLMSVSEWDLPIQRGGVRATVGEYSISSIGPGPRALRHWAWARRRGLRTIAKIQAGNSWELSAVPYIPALENVARHAANLRQAGVNGLMLGWTLGGYPSPNLEIVSEIAREPAENFSVADQDAHAEPPSVAAAMNHVASRRFGAARAPAIVTAWRKFSAAFSEFPFQGGVVYNAPMQCGPANLLWANPTGYHSTMVGFPYDDLDGWRQSYPAEIFIQQFEKIADGFAAAIKELRAATSPGMPTSATASGPESPEDQALAAELNVAEAAEIHFRSTANQSRFYVARKALAQDKSPAEKATAVEALELALKAEIELAARLHAIQSRDSRIGFEASNQYYYVPLDLVEKVLNCQHLLSTWVPSLRASL